ncbi:conserved Plasmodium protein, unknown function [Plasmodium vinckei vinckei]|uniref:Uncharacterized protein n=1 Tax=Plasmodium vinckei vinckei TaxID=54757 RepID=A0A449BPC9_PLAVN|nr:conserved Plasmodium protein, unknown function [Plasmodium vinckei vinckei]VEV55327.1 conserved Plasmodium protein, unknown function [Plasmodium vinckei vinckei]
MYLYSSNIAFSTNVKNINKHISSNLFCLSSKLFFKNESYTNYLNNSKRLENFNTFFLTKNTNIHIIGKKYFSDQSIINSIQNAKNDLDRASLYLLQKSISNNYKILSQEKKTHSQNAIHELNALLAYKSNLTEERQKILTEKRSERYTNKEMIGLFITGFFFAVGSVTHPLASAYGIYILHKASKENNSMLYIEKRLNDNKNKLLVNQKDIHNILTKLENDLIKNK